MGLDTNSLLILLLIFLTGYGVYATQTVKNKTRCIFIRANNTIIEKWARDKQRRIDFDNGWYYLNSKRLLLTVWEKGIFAIFPTKVQTQIFRWNSPAALNPRDFTNNWETPEARKALDKEEDIRAYSVGNVTVAGTKKKSMLEGYLPIILVVAVVAIGYMMYTLTQKVDMLGQAVNVLQQMMMGQ